LSDPSGGNPSGSGKGPGRAPGSKTDNLERLDGRDARPKAGKTGARPPRRKASGEIGPAPLDADSLAAGIDTNSLPDQAAPDENAQAEDDSDRPDSGLVWGKEAFVHAQTLVRQENVTAYGKVSALLAEKPDSPDLGLLKCQLVLSRNPTSAEARSNLAALLGGRPEYMHPVLFNEQAMFLLWKTDAAIYESQKTPENRIRLLKSANAYLSEFAPHAAYREKVKTIKARIPK